MSLTPIFEHEAPDNVKEQYKKIRESLQLPHIPLFFAFIGAFPEYLFYITDQLVSNLSSKEFIKMNRDISNQVYDLIHDQLPVPAETDSWLKRYYHTPSFYNFQKDLDHVFETNMKLTFIFIALREAVKGWAVAAKKLPETTSQVSTIHEDTHVTAEKFIFEQPFITETTQETQSAGLFRQQGSFLEKNLLHEYLVMCRYDFHHVMERDTFWIIRVGIEKIVLASLVNMPHLIFSPVNVVIQLTSKYPDFPDLLHLLSDHFPTYATQRMIFSGYMKPKGML